MNEDKLKEFRQSLKEKVGSLKDTAEFSQSPRMSELASLLSKIKYYAKDQGDFEYLSRKKAISGYLHGKIVPHDTLISEAGLAVKHLKKREADRKLLQDHQSGKLAVTLNSRYISSTENLEKSNKALQKSVESLTKSMTSLVNLDKAKPVKVEEQAKGTEETTKSSRLRNILNRIKKHKLHKSGGLLGLAGSLGEELLGSDLFAGLTLLGSAAYGLGVKAPQWFFSASSPYMGYQESRAEFGRLSGNDRLFRFASPTERFNRSIMGHAFPELTNWKYIYSLLNSAGIPAQSGSQATNIASTVYGLMKGGSTTGGLTKGASESVTRSLVELGFLPRGGGVLHQGIRSRSEIDNLIGGAVARGTEVGINKSHMAEVMTSAIKSMAAMSGGVVASLPSTLYGANLSSGLSGIFPGLRTPQMAANAAMGLQQAGRGILNNPALFMSGIGYINSRFKGTGHQKMLQLATQIHSSKLSEFVNQHPHWNEAELYTGAMQSGLLSSALPEFVKYTVGDNPFLDAEAIMGFAGVSFPEAMTMVKEGRFIAQGHGGGPVLKQVQEASDRVQLGKYIKKHYTKMWGYLQKGHIRKAFLYGQKHLPENIRKEWKFAFGESLKRAFHKENIYYMRGDRGRLVPTERTKDVYGKLYSVFENLGSGVFMPDQQSKVRGELELYNLRREGLFGDNQRLFQEETAKYQNASLTVSKTLNTTLGHLTNSITTLDRQLSRLVTVLNAHRT